MIESKMLLYRFVFVIHFLSDTGRIYIKGYLYPILYSKISKKDISYPVLEQDILRI
jgi:hypothetical protein